MAFMATIGSKSTNGVAAIHSEIIKETIFKVSEPPYPRDIRMVHGPVFVNNKGQTMAG